MTVKPRIKLTPRLVAGFAAVVVAVGIGAFVLLDLIFANQMTPARAAVMLQNASPALTAVLKHDFSDDFSRIVKATVDSSAEDELTGDNALARFLDHQTRPITKRYIEVARQAPPGLVAAWMGKLADTMDAVEKVAGAELCSRFVDKGQSALTDPAMLAKLAPVFDARDAAFFTALAGARDTPIADPVGEAANQDWQAVGAAMNGLEVPAGYAQIVASDDTKNPDYCPALAYYFRAVAALPGKAGERIRAEYFVRSFS